MKVEKKSFHPINEKFTGFDGKERHYIHDLIERYEKLCDMLRNEAFFNGSAKERGRKEYVALQWVLTTLESLEHDDEDDEWEYEDEDEEVSQ